VPQYTVSKCLERKEMNKRLTLLVIGGIFIAFIFYSLGTNKRNAEVKESEVQYSSMPQEQQRQEQKAEDLYIEDTVPLPNGIQFTVLVRKTTGKVAYFWRPSDGWVPIEKSNLNLQWAYDNRRTLRMMPNINQ